VLIEGYAKDDRFREARRLMVAPAEEGIDLFKIAGRSISGWIPSFKMGATSPVKQPFCSQLEERLLLWLEYHHYVVSYARGDIGPQFATAYRLPIPKHAPFAIGYTFEGKPHDYLIDESAGHIGDGPLFQTAETVSEDHQRIGSRGVGCSEPSTQDHASGGELHVALIRRTLPRVSHVRSSQWFEQPAGTTHLY
jgi:hypothetical protein